MVVKPSRQPQRQLNPIVKEVVKKEVLKLLDVGVIYPVADSKWVSQTQVVPKKSRVTVVANEHNELIPTRVTTGWRVSKTIGNSMWVLGNIISLYLLWIKCWRELQGMNFIVF